MIWVAGTLFVTGWVHMFMAGKKRPGSSDRDNQIRDDVHLRTGVVLIILAVIAGLISWAVEA